MSWHQTMGAFHLFLWLNYTIFPIFIALLFLSTKPTHCFLTDKSNTKEWKTMKRVRFLSKKTHKFNGLQFKIFGQVSISKNKTQKKKKTDNIKENGGKIKVLAGAIFMASCFLTKWRSDCFCFCCLRMESRAWLDLITWGFEEKRRKMLKMVAWLWLQVWVIGWCWWSWGSESAGVCWGRWGKSAGVGHWGRWGEWGKKEKIKNKKG